MYHYTTTLSVLGAREGVVHLWRYYIPQQALENPFLMHGLLALSALHLAHLKPDSAYKYSQACDKHQAIALRRFRSILSSPIDPTIADALLALAAILSVSAMARCSAPSKAATMDMDDIAELFVLTKGIRNIIQLAGKQQVTQGAMAVMFENSKAYPEGMEVPLPLHVSSCFEAMRHMLVTFGLDQGALEDCQSALAELEMIYKNIAHISTTGDIETGDVTRWQVMVPMGYVRLVQARTPPALVILAYYAAAVTAIRTAWYTQGWAECALRGISEALDGKMQQWIEWPMQQVQEKMSALGVRSPSVQSSSDGSNFYSPLTGV